MDIADHIIELLQQHETAVVPGLGSFHTSRVEGYYNKEQQLFYPPSLQAQFSKEGQEGTDLVELISERRQISAASARYFIEKFVTTLKETVGTESVPLGNMGVFTMRRSELIFEPNSLNESYELFYGLAPVKLKRASAFRQQAAEQETAQRSPFFEAPRVVEAPELIAPPEAQEIIIPEPIAVPVEPETYTAPIEPEPIESPIETAPIAAVVEHEPIVVPAVKPEAEHEEVYEEIAEHPFIPAYLPEDLDVPAPVPVEHHILTPPVHTVFIPEETTTIEEEPEEEEERKRGISIWLILAIIIVVLGVALVTLYKYQPELFSRFVADAPKPTPAVAPRKTSVTDSLRDAMQKQREIANDSTSGKLATSPITPEVLPTTARLDTFGVVIATLFTPKSADIEAQRYIKKGFPQAEVKRKPNSQRAYQITVGTYFNRDSAQANRVKLLERLKLTSDQIAIQKYPYKQP